MKSAIQNILNTTPNRAVVGTVGPTAVGKTAVALRIAEQTNAEIVSVDSRQIYKEISVGTAKPDADELERVPHHFVSERSISDPLTAAEYAEQARSRIESILEGGRRVLIVGGSTLYLHALLFGLDDVPPADPVVRARLTSRLESDDLESLVDELKRVDPTTAARMDLNNPRRVLRALEVYHSTGRPLSQFQQMETPNVQPPTSNLQVFVLNRPREILYARINARVDSMYAAGLVDEVKAILEAGYSPTLQALQTIGYRETIRYLDGKLQYDEMVDLVKRNTRRYAKRQLTWFRRYPSFEWVELKP